jgi:Right handed beta helix region
VAPKLVVGLCAAVACACLAAIVAAQGGQGAPKPCQRATGQSEELSVFGPETATSGANVPPSPSSLRPFECPDAASGFPDDPTVNGISRSSANKLLSGLAATVAAVAIVAPGSAPGAELSASPSNLDAVFAKANPGDTIRLESGSYGRFRGAMKPGRVSLRPAPGATVTMALDFSPAANITVSGVTLTDVVVAEGSRNITIRNSDIPGQVILRDLTNSNVTLDGNVHRGWDKCNGCAEGRVYIPGDLSRPSGITVKNSEFVGGVSDGIQNGSNGTKILGNRFHDLQPGTPNGVHTDAIQLYGSKNTVIRGNYIRDVPDAIMAPDGTDHEVIENNVIQGDRGGYPYAVTIWSDQGSIIRHNTFADGACQFNLRCGILSIGSKSGQPAGKGTVIEDNILLDISVGDGHASVASRGYNLLAGGQPRGPGESRGKPVYVGGSEPDSRRDFLLAPGSPGRGDASDGLDIGAVIDRGNACALAKKQLRRAGKRVAKARRAVQRADGRRQTGHARKQLRKAKHRRHEARGNVDQLC